eukprot:scaffold6695_cov136-Isochrysis_galbana.AAC.7
MEKTADATRVQGPEDPAPCAGPCAGAAQGDRRVAVEFQVDHSTLMVKCAKTVLCEQKSHVQPQVLPSSIFGTHTHRPPQSAGPCAAQCPKDPAQDRRNLRRILRNILGSGTLQFGPATPHSRANLI